MARAMLTTFDNPYNPFTDFSKWFLFDVEKGYDSAAYLGRVAKTSNQLSDEENDEEIESAIDEIVKLDPFNIYKKVKDDDQFGFAETANMGYKSQN